MTVVPGNRENWLRRFHPATAGAVRLLCLPHAGGSASYFFDLAGMLAPGLDVVCVQYPGRQDRRAEPPVESLDTLADQVFEALRPVPEQPLVLFGHSMGAVLAFELARRLEAATVGVPLGLIASGRRAPIVHRHEQVHLRSDAGLIAEVSRLSGTDSRLLDDEELVRFVLPALRADYRAVETYRYRQDTPLRSPITVLTGDRDPRVTLDDARAWEQLTTGGFDLRVFPGGHFYLQERRTEVAGAIEASVAAFRSSRSG